MRLRGWISQLQIMQNQIQQQVIDSINITQNLENIEKTIRTWEPREEKEDEHEVHDEPTKAQEWPEDAEGEDLQVVYQLVMKPPTASLSKVPRHRGPKGKANKNHYQS